MLRRPSFVDLWFAAAPSMKRRALSVLLLAIALTSMGVGAAELIVFGPQAFERGTGEPVTVTKTFTVTNADRPYVLRLTNHGVTSARVELNGRPILEPDDFRAKHGRNALDRRARVSDDADDRDVLVRIERPITLREGANTLAVEVRGKPGTSLTIEIVTAVTDATPPTITSAISPAPNSHGWNNTDVTVTFTCADDGSGVASCPAAVTVTAEGANQPVQGTAVDAAGNTASATALVSIDRTSPVASATVTPPAPANGWYDVPVTVHFTCSDTGSGLDSCPPDEVITAEGVHTIARTATDKAGNTASATADPIRIDLAPPVITVSLSPAPNANGWNNTPVTAHFTCIDSAPGATTCPPDQVLANDGANQTVTGTAIDAASRTASVTSGPANIDQAGPELLLTLNPAPNANGWYTGPVTAHFDCVDAASGVESCPADQVTTAEGIQTVTGTVTDKAGNTQSVVSDPIRIDLGAPAITATLTPAPNENGWNNSPVTVHFTCSDGGAGIETCPADQVVSSDGQGQSVTGTATDRAGNSAAAFAAINIDRAPPVLSFSTPADGAKVLTPTVSAAGTVADDLSGIAGVTCNGAQANVNGELVGCDVILARGPNSINATATDRAGNESSVALGVQYARVPVVRITSPATQSYLNVIGPATVTGTVDDPSAVVTVNSLAAPAADGAFSVALPLAEGPNVITATATSVEGGVGTASISVTLDTAPPHVTITSPPDQFITTEASVSVAGIVNDIVVGTVNEEQAQVTINVTPAQLATPAQVANRTFLAVDVPLTIGVNEIQALGRDRVGNAVTTTIQVTRRVLTQAQIRLVSGNNQAGAIGLPLASPLVVALTDAAGNPVANQPVIFKVAQNDGTLAAGDQSGVSLVATTDGQGRATARWTLGRRAGAGGNAVEAYAVGFEGVALFTASSTQGAAGKIVVDTGNDQIGLVDTALPKPFIAVVVDEGNNRLAGVPVTFAVVQGGGSFDGQPAVEVVTDSDGRAAATLTLGAEAGNANNFVQANFLSNEGFAAGFSASARAPGNPADTRISGVVLDNSNVPVPGVTVRAVLTNILYANNVAANAAPAVTTDAQGQFSLGQAPVGFVKLIVDGTTVEPHGTYPTLEYDMVTVVGQDNTVGQPIYILPINSGNQLCVDPGDPNQQGGRLTIREAPGFSLTFAAGQVTFPGGSQSGCISVTVVNGDKVPMVPGFGQQPRFIVTIQPAGAVFNPPAAITLPNVDGLGPREVTEMYSFDHDIGSFVAIGTGVVSEDGQIISSSPGVGVLKAGWHCGGNPSPTGAAANCPSCQICKTDHCEADPSQNGKELPEDKCKTCENGSPKPIDLNPVGAELSYTFGPPETATQKINDALKPLEKIGVIAKVNLLQITGKISEKECCDPAAGKGKGTELSGSVTGDFGGFSVKGKIWPPGPIPTFEATIDAFGLASLSAKAQFIGGVFINLSGKVTGEVGYKKKECSKDPADQAGCVFGKLEIGLTPSISAEFGGTASLTFDCFFCDKTTIAVAASLIAGELSWPISIAGVQFNTTSCSSGLTGGFFNPGDGSFKISAKFSGSYKTDDTGSRKVEVSFEFLKCSINSSGVSCS